MSYLSRGALQRRHFVSKLQNGDKNTLLDENMRTDEPMLAKKHRAATAGQVQVAGH